jgi:hypothetical protein
MSENFNEKDPLYQQGRKYQEQSFDKTMQRLSRWGDLEALAQQRLWFLLVVTLPKSLYKYSPLTYLVFVIPLALFVIGSSFGITSGLNHFDSNIIAAIGYFIFGAVCFALMFGSVYWGIRKAAGLNRAVATGQMILVVIYTFLSIWRTIEASGQVHYFSPGSSADGLSVLMFLFFAGMVASDVRRAWTNRRAME